MLSDTSPEAERVWIELWRKATPQQPLVRVFRMTRFVIGISRRALAEAHPELSELELKLLWVELHYGRDLADKVRAYLAEREDLAGDGRRWTRIGERRNQDGRDHGDEGRA